MKTDLTREQMLKALQEFAARTDSADWSVVYYSGLGIACNGINYMIPFDAKLKADRDHRRSVFSADEYSEYFLSQLGSAIVLALARPTKITFAEMREMGVRGLLIYCADYRCSHSICGQRR